MKSNMDLQQLHKRTGIELRKLRYCLDHELIPGLDIKSAGGEAGKPRKFARDMGFAIVAAAKLLELGLPHKRIRGFLEGLVRIRVPRKETDGHVLSTVLEYQVSAVAKLGDGVNVRILVEDFGYDSGWVSPDDLANLPEDYRPIVIVELDIGKIRDQVFNGA